MFLLLTILVLENTKVYISIMNYYNILFYIKISVNKIFMLEQLGERA